MRCKAYLLVAAAVAAAVASAPASAADGVPDFGDFGEQERRAGLHQQVRRVTDRRIAGHS